MAYVMNLPGVFILLYSGISAVQSYSTGPPAVTCLTMFPMHQGAEKMVTPSPFTIKLSSSTYNPSQKITVFVEGSDETTFKGFQIRAHRVTGDTEVIMGTFTSFPDQYLKTLSCFGGDNNMVVHKSNTEKHNLTLDWRAPDTPVGDLVFEVTIVSSFKEFWADQRSTVLIDIGGSSALGSKQNVHNTDPEMDLDGKCGKTKGCFLYPKHCTGDGCQAAVSFQTIPGYVQFEMMAKAEGYISLGFSHDKFMAGFGIIQLPTREFRVETLLSLKGDDETLSCTAQGTRVTVQRGYNPALYNERQYKAGIVNMTTVQKEGYIYCRFARPIVMSLVSVNYTLDPPTLINQTFDFSKDWYLFLAWGNTYIDTDVLKKHKEIPAVTAERVNLSSSVIYRGSVLYAWRQVHGSLAVISWMLLVGLGTVVARFYREGTGAHTVCGQKRWLQVHRFLLGLAAACTAASFILAFAKVKGWSKHVYYHTYLGMAIMAAIVLQVCGGLIRPSPASTIRPVFNWLHRILGKLTHAAAAVQVYLGFSASQFPYEMRQFGFILVLTWVISQVFWEIVMEITSCCILRRNSGKDYDVSNRFTLKEDRYSNGVGKGKTVILILYMINITGVTAAALCAILVF